MSSNPRADRRRPQAKGLEAWPLRRRIIAEQIILLAVVCVVIVAVTLLALQAFLVNQLDDQLTEARGRVERSLPPRGPGDGPPGGQALLNAQGPGSVIAVLQGGTVVNADLRDVRGEDSSVPASAYTELVNVPTDGEAYTRDLGSLGTFRVTAMAAPTGEVVVTGLPRADVNDTLLSTGLILGGIALAGLLAAAAAGALIVRRTL